MGLAEKWLRVLCPVLFLSTARAGVINCAGLKDSLNEILVSIYRVQASLNGPNLLAPNGIAYYGARSSASPRDEPHSEDSINVNEDYLDNYVEEEEEEEAVLIPDAQLRSLKWKPHHARSGKVVSPQKSSDEKYLDLSGNFNANSNANSFRKGLGENYNMNSNSNSIKFRRNRDDDNVNINVNTNDNAVRRASAMKKRRKTRRRRPGISAVIEEDHYHNVDNERSLNSNDNKITAYRRTADKSNVNINSNTNTFGSPSANEFDTQLMIEQIGSQKHPELLVRRSNANINVNNNSNKNREADTFGIPSANEFDTQLMIEQIGSQKHPELLVRRSNANVNVNNNSNKNREADTFGIPSANDFDSQLIIEEIGSQKHPELLARRSNANVNVNTNSNQNHEADMMELNDASGYIKPIWMEN